MSIFKQLTAALLALLLANPACCCTFSSGCCAKEEAQAVSAPEPACCSGASEQLPEQDNQDEHQCPCSLNKKFPESAKNTFAIPDIVSGILPQTDFPRATPPCPRPTSFSLPASDRSPPGSPLRILYSVFRL